MNTSRFCQQLSKIPLLCWPILFIICCSWAPYLLTLSHDLSFGDEGVVAQGAYRIFRGDVPFKDFFTGLTPGSFYVYAFLFKFFEPTFLVMRLGVCAVSASLIISSWLILSRFSVRSSLPYIMTSLFLAYFGGPVWFVASHHWLAAVLCILSLYFLIPVFPATIPSYGNCIIAGFFSSTAACMLQHRGAIWIIAGSFAILLLPQGNRLKSLGAYWAGIAVFAAPLAFYFIMAAGWDTVYYDLVSFPLHQYAKLEGHSGIDIHPIQLVARYLSAWKNIARPGDAVQIFIWTFGLAGMYFVYAAPFMALYALFHIRSESHLSRYHLGLLSGALVASYLTTLHRLSDTTLFFATPVALVMITLALSFSLESGNQKAKYLSKQLLTGFSVIFLITACGYSYLMFSRQAAVFETPAGRVKTIFKEERSTLKLLTPFISKHFNPDDTVFCYPYNPIHYFLFRIKNPTHYDILTYPMYTLEQMNEVKNNLEKQKTRWIIVDSYQKKELHREIPFEEYLMEHYTVKVSSPYATIMERHP